MDKFPTKDISQIDSKHSFFHYTNLANLDSIFKNGLEPRVGENSLYVEKTPKIFFVEGEKGIINIIDVWLKWLTGKINTSKTKYWFGTKIYMKIPFCIKSIPNRMLKNSLSTKSNRLRAHSAMKQILDNSVFLILNLKENIDFSYNDIDEVKNTYYASFLKLLYPKDSNLTDPTMEYWNLHTFSNQSVSPDKITLLKAQNQYIASDILAGLIKQNLNYVKENCNFLYEYYLYIQE